MPWSEWLEPPWMVLPVTATDIYAKTTNAVHHVDGIYHLGTEAYGSQFTVGKLNQAYTNAMGTIAEYSDTKPLVGYSWLYQSPGRTHPGDPGINAYSDEYEGYVTPWSRRQYDYSSMNDPSKMFPAPLVSWEVAGYYGSATRSQYEYETTNLTDVDFASYDYGIGTYVPVTDQVMLIDFSWYAGSWRHPTVGADIPFSAEDTVKVGYGTSTYTLSAAWNGTNRWYNTASTGQPVTQHAVPFDLLGYLRANNFTITEYVESSAATQPWLFPSGFEAWNGNNYTRFTADISIKQLFFKPPRYRYWINTGTDYGNEIDNFNPGAQVPASDAPQPAADGSGSSTVLDQVRAFSSSVRRAVRLTGTSTIEMVNPNELMPASMMQADADGMYYVTRQSLQAGEDELRLKKGSLTLTVEAGAVSDDVRVVEAHWRAPGRLPVYDLDPSPVRRMSWTFTPERFTADYDFHLPDPPLKVRRT